MVWVTNEWRHTHVITRLQISMSTAISSSSSSFMAISSTWVSTSCSDSRLLVIPSATDLNDEKILFQNSHSDIHYSILPWLESGRDGDLERSLDELLFQSEPRNVLERCNKIPLSYLPSFCFFCCSSSEYVSLCMRGRKYTQLFHILHKTLTVTLFKYLRQSCDSGSCGWVGQVGLVPSGETFFCPLFSHLFLPRCYE